MQPKSLFERIRDIFSSGQSYYFIATVRETKEMMDGREFLNHDSRCVGFYRNLSTAVEAIENNWCDMNEMGWYQYAVIEKRTEGLYGIDLSLDGGDNGAIWFRQKFLTTQEMAEALKGYPEDWQLRKRKDGSYEWDDLNGNGTHSSYNGYERCETPEWAKLTTGYTIG